MYKFFWRVPWGDAQDKEKFAQFLDQHLKTGISVPLKAVGSQPRDSRDWSTASGVSAGRVEELLLWNSILFSRETADSLSDRAIRRSARIAESWSEILFANPVGRGCRAHARARRFMLKPTSVSIAASWACRAKGTLAGEEPSAN